MIRSFAASPAAASTTALSFNPISEAECSATLSSRLSNSIDTVRSTICEALMTMAARKSTVGDRT